MKVAKGKAITLRLKVTPRASHPRIEEEAWGLRIWVKAPPERGKANKELKKVLARKFDVPTSSVEIIRGETSRDKLVRVADVTNE